MRLIDWDNVLEWMHRQKETTEQWSMRIAIENYVDEMPTIDPVKHGRWIDITESFKTRLPKTTRTDEDEYVTIRNYISTYKCSVCHTVFQRDYKYCPNCGCKMDEVSE